MNPLIKNVTNISLQLVSRNCSKLNYQSFRYNLQHKRKEPFRKPIWQTIAPSKLYRINNGEKLSPEEAAKRQIWKENYDNEMKFVKDFLRKEFYLPTLEDGGRSHDQVIREEEEQKKLIEENEQDNMLIAQAREKRMKEFTKERAAQLMAKQMQIDEENRLKGKFLDELVRKEIENSKNFITHDNLDERIEKAINTRATYLD